MTMPWGSAEEPMHEEVGLQSVPIHVASSALKPGKPLGTEFGQTRTIIVANVVGPYSVTPGAQRVVPRSLRRSEARISVLSGGNVTTTPGVTALPAISVSGQAVQNPNAVPVNVTLAGFTATQVFVNGILVGAGNGTYVVPAFGSISVTYTVVGTTATAGIATTGAQPSTDGVILAAPSIIQTGLPAIAGQLGGFLPIGKDLVWKSQAELWCAYPVGNVGQVVVMVTDYQWASGPDDYKEFKGTAESE